MQDFLERKLCEQLVSVSPFLEYITVTRTRFQGERKPQRQYEYSTSENIVLYT